MEIKMEERLKNILSFVNDWLKFAEAKNGALVVLNGAIIFGVLSVLNDNKIFVNWQIFYFWMIIGFNLLSLIVGLLSFWPQTKNSWLNLSGYSNKEDNILFFAHISKYNPTEYLKSLYEAEGTKKDKFTKFEIDYSNQIIINSQIASQKYRFFKLALWLTLAGFLTLIGAVLVTIVLSPNKK